MKIIIVGNGKVGYAIARQLAVEGHDITMVDSSPVALARADSTLDLMCVEGNGASISVLEEAGARTRLRSAAFLSRSAPAAVSGQARSSMVSSSVYSTASSAQAGASAS